MADNLLSQEDLAVVRETLQEIREMPPPRDNRGLGCLLFAAGLVVLVGLPLLARSIPAVAGLGRLGLLFGGAFTVVGLVMYMTAGGFVRGNYVAAAEAALRELEAWSPEEGDRVTALRAATLLLTHAVNTYGPTSTSSFEVPEAEERIAHMLPLVRAVQEVLVQEEAVYPVFE